MTMAYGMYVMSISDLLELDQLYPHQVMVEKGVVKEWTEAWHGRVIFVSHEWLAWDHADPAAEQLRALQQILKRLMNGEIASVESFWQQQAACCPRR